MVLTCSDICGLRWGALWGVVAASLWLIGCSAVEIPQVAEGEVVPLQQITFPGSEAILELSGSKRLMEEYRISPGDQLDVLFQISTWEKDKAFKINLGDSVSVRFTQGYKDFIEPQQVRPDGTISLPGIGQVDVVGMTIDQLEANLKKRYERILHNPELFIMVPEYLAQIRELKRDLRTASRGLSRLVTVRPDGFVTFPMVGDVQASNRTMKEVKDDINTYYAEHISPSLHVDLFLEKHSGALIYVLGEVEKPGAYPINKPLTVPEAMAMASGYKTGSYLDGVVVVRREGKDMVGTRVDVTKGLGLREDGSFFYLQPDDIVYIPMSPIAHAGQLARSLADVVLFRGWDMGLSWQLHRDPAFGPNEPLKAK